MIQTAIIVGGGIVVAILLYLVTIRRPSQRQPDSKQREWIVTTLESIRLEADRKRLDIHATPKIDVNSAFGQLRDLMNDYPGPTRQKIEELATGWQNLASQYAEFEGQGTGSTLQNSLLATRTSKLANEIGALVKTLESEL